jgi:hypothetical protein
VHALGGKERRPHGEPSGALCAEIVRGESITAIDGESRRASLRI